MKGCLSFWLLLILFTVDLRAQETSRAGDDFYQPHILSGENPTAREDTRTATAQPSERPVFGGGGPYHTVWWSWRPPTAGLYSISTRGSNFDTTLGVSVGEDLETLTTLISNDDDPAHPPFSLVKFLAYPSTNYMIRVDGLGGEAGLVHLSVALEEPLASEQPAPRAPANDNFTNRTVLVGMNVLTNGSNVGATSESGEPRHATLSPMATVWWKWTPPTNGLVRITTADSDFDTILAVYGHFLASPAMTTLAPMAANDDAFRGGRTSEVAFFVPGRTNLFIAVEGAAWRTGHVSLRIDMTPVLTNQPNDQFETRLPLEGSSIRVEGSNIGASAEPGEPAIVNPSRASVWWRWRAPASGRTFVSAIPMALAPLPSVAVFTGTSVSMLIPVARIGPVKPSVYAFDAVAGTEYAIGFDSQHNSGLFGLALEQREDPTPVPLSIRLSDDRATAVVNIGPADGNTVLYSSEDLINWFPISTNTAEQTTIAMPIASGNRFFHVQTE